MKKITILGILLLLIFPGFVEARTLNDMYNELAKLQTEYNSNKNNKNLTQSQINEINTEINTINKSIATIRTEIKQAELDIEESKGKIDDKKTETDGLIQFLQISNGGNIYLEYLFDAENYTDFIYRYEVVKQLTNYNSDLISELEELILDLQAKEKELEENKVKLENERSQLNTRLVTLQTSLNSYQVEGANIKDDITALQQQIKIYEDRGCSRYQDVDSCTAMVNAKGWTYPLVKGCVTSEYTGSEERTDYSGGGTHYGIDLGCVSEGTKIYAAAAGVVSKIIKEYKCGGNMVYIQHIVNGKSYTTVYMHMLKFASGLSVGDTVTANTVIGYVGGWSTSKKNGGHDGCTTGAHLHFGMAEGHHASFNPYAFNPREIFGFPKLIYSGGGYFYR